MVADAYFAGWDASGASFSGGYSIHHALGNDKQFVSWFGQPLQQSIPAATLKVGFNSNFLGVVDRTGAVSLTLSTPEPSNTAYQVRCVRCVRYSGFRHADQDLHDSNSFACPSLAPAAGTVDP